MNREKFQFFFLIFSPFFIFFSGYYLAAYFLNFSVIKVPNFISKDIAQAVKIASNNDIFLKILAEKDALDLPPNLVISQNPLPDSFIKPEQIVYLIVTKKPSESEIMNFVGMNENSLKSFARNFKSKTYYVEAGAIDGQIIAQDPPEGQIFDSTGKSVISFYVNKNHKGMAVCPDFKEQELSQVIEFLKNNEFEHEIRHLQAENHPSLRLQVEDQRPLPGTIINLEKKPKIYLKVGPFDNFS